MPDLPNQLALRIFIIFNPQILKLIVPLFLFDEEMRLREKG